jgi:hypothetical protein
LGVRWGELLTASKPYEVVRIGVWGVERWTHANPVAGKLHEYGFDLEFIDMIPYAIRLVCFVATIAYFTKTAISIYREEYVLAHDLTQLIIDEDLADDEESDEPTEPVDVQSEALVYCSNEHTATTHNLTNSLEVVVAGSVNPGATKSIPQVTRQRNDKSQRDKSDYVSRVTPRSTIRGRKSRLHTRAILLRHELCRLLTADTKRDTPANRATVDARARRLASSLRSTDNQFKYLRARDLTSVIETAVELYFVPTDDELQIQEQFTGNPEHIARKERYRYPEQPSL